MYVDVKPVTRSEENNRTVVEKQSSPSGIVPCFVFTVYAQGHTIRAWQTRRIPVGSTPFLHLS